MSISYDKPKTSSKHYAFVEPSDSGSMPFDGQQWGFVETLETFDRVHGETDESITHSYGGDVIEYDGQNYHFIASGLQNPESSGGYDSYTSQNERTVYFLFNRSNDVIFYYTLEEHLPEDRDYYIPTNALRVAIDYETHYIPVIKIEDALLTFKLDDKYFSLIDTEDDDIIKVESFFRIAYGSGNIGIIPVTNYVGMEGILRIGSYDVLLHSSTTLFETIYPIYGEKEFAYAEFFVDYPVDDSDTSEFSHYGDILSATTDGTIDAESFLIYGETISAKTLVYIPDVEGSILSATTLKL